ncbi:hypothetical protein BDV97DRAFT_374480 [Delphinella strobiligena]|nr:hypothetical protein BDV97DRAFT_374480 [Delphinella strobiligena]
MTSPNADSTGSAISEPEHQVASLDQSQNIEKQTSEANKDVPDLETPANTQDNTFGEEQAPPVPVESREEQGLVEDKIAQEIGKLSLKQRDAASTTLSTEEEERVGSPSPPPPPPKDDKFLIRSKESAGKAPVVTNSGDEYDEKQAFEDHVATQARKHVKDDDERSEIQSIMDQFENEDADAELEKIMTPRLDMSSSTFHPPRTSSLDPVAASHANSPALQRTQSRDSYMFTASAVRPGSISGVSGQNMHDISESPRPASTIFQPPPPSPDPEPALPFDFHRFLEQLRHRTADPVARFLRSFLAEFGKKQWMVHEQVKIIADFLEFIAKKMALCEVWRTVSDVEFDNAREGMEKLVMNRLYNQTFSPAIPPMELTSPTKSKRSNRNHTLSTQPPGRKGQHQEDVERDAVIAQKIRIYGWIREEHLDIAPVNDKGRKFLVLAQQELLKINSYRAPRDKVICVLNCCKVIFGFLKNSKGDQSADSFVPLLIYTVLRANPEHLVSNVQYILRFRNQEKLGGEAGYYISSLMGVVSFVENLDRTNLTVTDEEFERNVEASVSAIAEGHKAEEYEASKHDRTSSAAVPTSPTKSYQPHYSEKGAPSRPELTPRNSTDGERALRRGNSARQKSRGIGSSDEADEKDAVSGLLRSIQKPLSTIGRMFSDEMSPSLQHPALTPQPGSTPRLSPGPQSRPLERKSSEEARRLRSPDRQQRARSVGAPRDSSHVDEDAAARQAQAENVEAQRIQAQEHRVVVETLQGMFPNLDRDVISDVVRQKEGRVGLAVDACLALSS